MEMLQSTAPLLPGGPVWLTLPFVIIGIGVIIGVAILWWGAVCARRAANTRRALEAQNEIHEGPSEAASPFAELPAARPLPPIAPPPEPEPEPAPPRPTREPVVEEAPAPSPLADEPIAAAAPLDAGPAALAADLAEPVSAEPATDDLTRMKGVGPRLAQRLNGLGITRFEQIASLSPSEAEALDAQLGDFQGRMARDRWIEQAGYLAKDDLAGFEGVFGKL